MKTCYANKRIAAFLLAACMTLSVLPAHVGAQATPLDSGGEMTDSGPIPDVDLPKSSSGVSKLGGIGPQAVATGFAQAITGTNIILVTLSSGAFAASGDLQNNYFTLGGTGGQSIQGITRVSAIALKLSLSATINQTDNLSITAAPDAFVAGTATFGTMTVYHAAYAAGTAAATAGTKEITVRLTAGSFSITQSPAFWILGGGASAENSIEAAQYVDQQEVKLTLDKSVGASDGLNLNVTQSAFTNLATAPFASPMTVTIAPSSENICQIGETGYTSLDAALRAAQTGETITLLQDIDHVTDTAAKVVRIDGKTVIFNLAGYTLNVGDAGVAQAVVVENGGKLELLGNSGALNVTAYGDAVQVLGAGSAATVTSATSANNIGVYAAGGGEVTVRGDAVGKIHGVGVGALSDLVGSTVTVGGDVKVTESGRAAISAGKGARVTVDGRVATTGTGGYGVLAGDPNTEIHIKGNVLGPFNFCVDASNSAKVRVDGNVTSTYASMTCGVRAQTKAEVIVGGNISVNNQTGSTGVRVKSLAGQTPTKVTVDGTISGKIYIQLDGTDKTAEQKTGAEAGYNVYTLTNTNGTHTVWVKDTSAPTPLATPAGLDWDTATAGVIKAKWNQVAGAQSYEVRLYKVGDSQGHHGILNTNTTSVHLTAALQTAGAGSYTFTVKALAPSESTDYVDSAVATSVIYTYAVTAVPAEGNAWATLYTKSIFVRLSQGEFKAVQNKAYWTLGGDGASGNAIVGVTPIDNTEVQITLTNDINALDALTITADQDAFATGTAPFAAPLTVRLDNPSTYACTIDGVAYPSLKKALEFALAPTVNNKTIVLAADIRYEEPVVVEGKTLTFDLSGKNLVIDTSATVTGDWLTASALKVDNGSVSYTGEGKFTVCGERRGVEAIHGGSARVSEILIKNPGHPYPGHYYVYGAHAWYQNNEGAGSQITVTGGIRTLSGKPCDYVIGALAGQDSTVTVGGDIFMEGGNVIGLSAGSFNDGNGTVTAQNVTVTGEYATGVSAAGVSTATVNGAVTATGAYAVGVDAGIAEDGSGGTVIVKGDAAATGANSTGVICFSSAPNPHPPRARSMVSVDGTVSGENYLNIDNAVRAKDAKDSVTGGYWIYNGQYESVVKVKDPDGGTPVGNVPTAPQNFTATPGSGQVALSWTAPTSAGDSAITGYQVSKDGGTSWTNVGLTTAYTFINLINGTEYTFKVRSVNSAGSGAQASRTATPTSAPSVPTVPRNFTASPGFERVILNWDAPTSNGGSSIVRYEVSKNNSADWTSAGLYTRYEFTGLTNGTEYTFTVRAVNSVGSGAEASITAMPSDLAQTFFTVNFYNGSALYASKSVRNGSAAGREWPSDPRRNGYALGGWFTGENGAGTRYTSATLITADVDLYARWTRDEGGSAGNGSGSGGAPANTPAAPPNWLEQSQTAGPVADAQERGGGYALTRSNGPYGVRADAWPTFDGYQYWHDTMDGDAVQVRVCVPNPAAVTTDLLLSGHVKGPEVERVKNLFEKHFDNKLCVMHLDQTEDWGQPVGIVAKVDLTGMDITQLVFYSYDSATNTYRRIAPDYWVDENGYLHFTTPYAGDIVISEGPLARL